MDFIRDRRLVSAAWPFIQGGVGASFTHILPVDVPGPQETA